MMRVKSPKSKSSQRGFTLLEVLIAIVVLALGLLGLAALQMNALKSADVSYQRSIATLAAQDLAERTWGFLLASPDYFGESDATIRKISCPDDIDRYSSSGVLGGTDLSDLDVIYGQWKDEWAPDGGPAVWKLPWSLSATPITLESASQCLYRIELEWVDERFGGEEVASLVYRFGVPQQK
ncbi:type IV pilus modification protein PilV [Halomonas shengliensis]|uniref:type IV pilus modification protein PilV n=1 Tax=Halomonas shengliensis TaxID=419597 RepID=UPI001FE072C6|nr:type IV pilus modification protein PilV [Halomonas shengliensis]